MLPEARFPLGRVLITPGALRTVDPIATLQSLRRHSRGDWGELCAEDIQENELSLAEGYRLLSAYTDPAGRRFWIITEADRSATTILLPSEY